MNPISDAYRVLVIEDNPPDIELLKFMFAECSTPTDLYFVKNGEEASDFVNKRNVFAQSPTPELILMDLNIPLKDGRELLKEFKADPEHRRIPVIMVTTSSSDREIRECYALGASAFISKPVDIDEIEKLVRRIVEFWFESVKLPSRVFEQ